MKTNDFDKQQEQCEVIDNDDNYVDVTHEDFNKIKTTGRLISEVPIFMQRVPVKPTNKNFIQVGIYARRGEKKYDYGEGIPIFARRTKELEESEKKMLENFAEAIAPIIHERIVLHYTEIERLKNYILEMEQNRDKKIALLNKKHKREIERIEKDFATKLDYAKKVLSERLAKINEKK